MRGLIAADQRSWGWLVWLWAGFIFFCSTDLAGTWADAVFAYFIKPGGPPNALLKLVAQKSFHVFLFGTLGLLAALPHPQRNPVVSITICVGVGIASELFQGVWPSRHPSTLDALLNALSGLAAFALFFRWLSRRPTTAGN